MKDNEFPDGGGEEGWPKEYIFPRSHMVPLCFLTFSLLTNPGRWSVDCGLWTSLGRMPLGHALVGGLWTPFHGQWTTLDLR